MSDSCSTSSSNVTSPSQCEIDASCRMPLVSLFAGAAVWLLVAAIAAVIATLSFHKPDMFADKMALSYGRILPFAKTAFLYGFCLPAGYGIALWLAARLGRTTLACGFTSTLAAKIWHLGVFIGASAILCGASTGYEGFEMPGYAMLMLLVASVLLGFVGLVTIHKRTERELYPSLWFIITALFWFPWILSTALLTLGYSPVRGVAQIAVAGWYQHNLQFVVLGLFGIGSLFYFIPKLSGKDLPSKYLALFTYFALTLFGTWGGIAVGTPLPAWMSSLCAAAALFSVITVISVMENLRTVCCVKAPVAEAKFFSFSAGFLFAAVVLGAIAVLPVIGPKLGLTLFHTGKTQFLVAGFFGMIALGGIYHVLPKVADIEWPCAKSVKAHLWLATIGVLLIGGAYAIGGWQQGAKLAAGTTPFVDIAKSTLMPIRMATLGELLWAIGSLLFVMNMFSLIYRRARACMSCCDAGGPGSCATAEVKS